MRKRFFILFFLTILLILAVSAAHAQVQTVLRIYEASNQGKGNVSSLREENDEFKSLFSFSNYQLLREEAITLYPNKPVLIPLDKRTVELLLIGQHKDVSKVRVIMREEKREILNTQVRLSPRRNVSIGGPKYGEGVLLLTLSARQ